MADDPIVLIGENSQLAASPRDIAWMIGIHPDYVYSAIKSGDLQTFRCGNKNRILRTDAEAWVRSWPKNPPRRK